MFFFFLEIQSQILFEDITGNGKYIFKTLNVWTTNFIYFLLSVTLNIGTSYNLIAANAECRYKLYNLTIVLQTEAVRMSTPGSPVCMVRGEHWRLDTAPCHDLSPPATALNCPHSYNTRGEL